MLAFLVRRILWLIPVLLVVTFLTFVLMRSTKGGPWSAEKALPPATVAALNRQFHLDWPWYQQYANYLWNAARGDLGPSFSYRDRNVTDIILQGLPTTAQLGLQALVLALLLGLPLGIIAALRQNSVVDYLSMFLAVGGITVPSFVLGIFLMLVFAVTLQLVPTHGWTGPATWVLPTITLATYPTAVIARYTRASMLEVRRQDYVRTARAKGLAERVVVVGHMLKNALIPVVTVLGPMTAFLVTGSFIIEYIFSIPGIGRLYILSISQRDYSLIMGTTVFYAVVVALMNVIVDVLYAALDPRITYR